MIKLMPSVATAGLLFGAPAASAESNLALALIDVTEKTGSVEIVGRALALGAGTYAGEMTIERKGQSGTVSTRQSGEWQLAAGESADIARVGVNVDGGDSLAISVVIRREGAVVATSKLTAGD